MSEEKEFPELPDEIEVVGPGVMLREARLAMGLSQSQVASQLNFRTQLIEQIEAQEFNSETPATFTRGYLKNYAKLVGVSQEDVLAAYDHLGVAASYASKMQSFSQLTKKQSENKMIMGLTYVILLGLIGLTVVWWYQQEQAVSSSEPTTEAQVFSASSENGTTTLISTETIEVSSDQPSNDNQAVNVATSELGVQTDIEPSTEQATEQSFDESLEAANNAVESDSSLTVNEDTLTTQTTALQTLEANNNQESDVIAREPIPVSFYFAGDCWVNIYDATGERVAWGVKKADYTMNITGIPPFKVTLGKPELVTIDYDGVPIDLSQFKKGLIAKFELPLAE